MDTGTEAAIRSCGPEGGGETTGAAEICGLTGAVTLGEAGADADCVCVCVLWSESCRPTVCVGGLAVQPVKSNKVTAAEAK